MVKNKFYYDIGLRKGDKKLSKMSHQLGHDCPRYLEDFIDVYGANNIKILTYGKLWEEKDYINNLFK